MNVFQSPIDGKLIMGTISIQKEESVGSLSLDSRGASIKKIPLNSPGSDGAPSFFN